MTGQQGGNGPAHGAGVGVWIRLPGAMKPDSGIRGQAEGRGLKLRMLAREDDRRAQAAR